MTKSKKTKLLYKDGEWSMELMEDVWQVINKYGKEWLGLDFYEPEFHLTTAEQMMSAVASIGLPVHYDHWSLGKDFLKSQADYKHGHGGKIYELVINSDPAIAYLLETNTMTEMAVVMAHAAVGHNSVNKMNYKFHEGGTQARLINSYMKFAKQYITECEDRYGAWEVESVLDLARRLSLFSVDRYQRKNTKKGNNNENLYKNYRDIRENISEEDLSIPGYVRDLERKIHYLNQELVRKERVVAAGDSPRGLPEENLLYFLEKCSPGLANWEKEILRIVRIEAQYFQPQRELHVLHEGWASFCHYLIVDKMWEDGHITDGSYLEFINFHTKVVAQKEVTNHFNPYYLGFNMFQDLKRVCEKPDEEDQHWFPELCNTDWKESLKEIMKTNTDVSFIKQYLGPKVIRSLKMMLVQDYEDLEYEYLIGAIHDDDGVWAIREALSQKYGIGMARLPTVEVVKYNTSNHTCILSICYPDGYKLDEESEDVFKDTFELLWGYEVEIKTREMNYNPNDAGEKKNVK